VLLSISALGSSVAPNFDVLLMLYSFIGISRAVVVPMSQVLIGKYIAVKEFTIIMPD